MARIGLNAARAVVRHAIYQSNSSFTDELVDEAIKAACQEFLQAVPADTDTVDVSLGNGDSTVDLTAEIDGFIQNDFVDRASIDNARVRLAPFEMVQRRWASGTPSTGQPTLIGFREDDHALFDKPTDQSYTLKVTHRKGLIVFNPGTGSNPTINIPENWVYQVLKSGGVAYLLSGGHIISRGDMSPGAGSAYEAFQKLMEDAKQRFPRTTNQIQDLNAPTGA